MTSMLSKIKNLGEHDFSAGLSEKLFKMDDLARYGIDGNINCTYFEPVQSLLVIGTDKGSVHVMGQQNVAVNFVLNSADPVGFVRIIHGVYLAAVDTRGNTSIIDLEMKEIVYTHKSYSKVTAVESDPALDWLFLGLENGQVIVFDVDRGIQAPYRIGSLQKSLNSKARMSTVVSLALHPRDISTLLVAYNDVTVIFSLAKSEILFPLVYKLPPGAPGGDGDPLSMNKERIPRVVLGRWHPNGHHILTAHEDGSLVFWDGTEGTLLQARTTIDTDVNISRKKPSMGAKPLPRDPILDITWSCTENPEETSLLISGGDVDQGAVKGMTMLEFGPTPQVAITSYQAMGNFYANPKKHKIFPLPEGVAATDLLMITNNPMPYYAGNFNPKHVLCILTSGELLMMKYPEGYIVTDPTVLPADLGWINPFVSAISASLVPRTQWIGMMASAHSKANCVFKGGAPAKRHLRTFQSRCALCTGHTDGTVKVWDASHGELEDAQVLEMNMSCALARHKQIAVSHISFAGEVAEAAVASINGDVVLFSFGVNTHRNLASSMSRMRVNPDPPHIEDIKDRCSPGVKEGFMPKYLVHTKYGPVSALCNSNIGFVAIGYVDGTLLVIDRRGPAAILTVNLQEVTDSGRSRFSRRASANVSQTGTINVERVTKVEFSIHGIGDDGYSSIVLTAGSSTGNIYTFKVLPAAHGGYTVNFVGSFSVGAGPIIALNPFNLESGETAGADPAVMMELGKGALIQGALIAVTPTDARVIRQPSTKISHKKLNFTCLSAGYSSLKEGGGDNVALVCVGTDGSLRTMALPSLRDIKTQKLPYDLSPGYGKDSVVTSIGEVILRPTKASGALIKVCGRGFHFGDITPDDLYDALKIQPPRPTISTLQWVKGRQYTTIEDLDKLIGGPRRPRPRKVIEQEQARNEQERLINMRRPGTSNSSESSFWSQSQGHSSSRSNHAGGEQERSAYENIQESFNSFGQGANEYLNSMSEMVNDAGKSAKKASFGGALRSKFF